MGRKLVLCPHFGERKAEAQYNTTSPTSIPSGMLTRPWAVEAKAEAEATEREAEAETIESEAQKQHSILLSIIDRCT